MLRTLSIYLFTLISLLASIITILLYSQLIYPQLSPDNKIATLCLIIFCSYYFLENIYLKFTGNRKKDYEQALALIFDGLSDVHRLDSAQPDIERAVRAFTKLCNFLAKAFTVVTGTNCSVTIKILAYDEDAERIARLRAITFCRDEHAEITRSNLPYSGNVKHWIHENTDYAEILYNPHAANYN